MQLRQRDGRLRLIRNPPRELSRPAFIFSSVRSGSTLLRLILSSHSQVYAPHELHLANIKKVEFGHAADWQSTDEVTATVTRYLTALCAARNALPGHTVRYEDLTADPAGEAKRICSFLGIGWEPAMVAYGNQDHGELKFGLGDWTEKIRTGSVQAPHPLPAVDLPPRLRELATDLGY
jgi:hypothetical protein